ncbi:MAG TPA: serine hydrolase [Terriglobia bacterium]|nr:serine hydrolase [Terriglobia bacterium]
MNPYSVPRIATASLLTLVLVAQSDGQSARVVPSDAEIRQILVERVDKYRQSVGIVVGVIGPSGRRIISYGNLAAGDSRPLNGDTVFEIGSITKVFTSLLLADMVGRNEVALSDPVAKYLPATVRVPERRGEQITLEDLATHTSGLPRMPANVDSRDPANPFAEYSVDRLYDFLSNYRLPRDIGESFEYSNIGGALLGHALSQRAASTYESLVQSRITGPLGMKSTGIVLNSEMKARLAVGHGYGLEPTPNWDMGALGAAGALRSTANDLLTFLSANLGYTKTPLSQAMAAMVKDRRDRDRGTIGLAWFFDFRNGVEIISHSGSTGGYLSFIGYEPRARIGVVVLSNSGTGPGVDDIGIHLLNPKAPLLDVSALQPPKERKEIEADSNLLDSYVGRYQFPSGQMAAVTREGGHLLLQGEGEVKIVFYPESNREFFARIMDAQLMFNTDAQGHVTEIIFHRSGADLSVKRVD